MQQDKSVLKYRPDIDGLRAIAVISVLIYHLQESLLPGGFVGVDIFFVISGYLITKLIFSELSATDTFSFKHFYLRRIRRLFPALLATLLFSLAFAYKLFSPAYLVEFAQSLIASIFSVSNFFFWSQAGYFDSDNSVKPLLHTWSLSVEEQFYIIWPAVLVGLFALKNKIIIPSFIIAMGIASLLLNTIFFSDTFSTSSWVTDQNNETIFDVQSTVFYWLPFRVFEFSIGAILVWFGSIRHQFFAQIAFLIGLAMVVISVFSLNSEMDFPSTTALLPCLGAALMIASGPNHRLSWFVANRAMIGVGLISYSLYLIHWPLIVFYKYSIGREFNNTELVLLILVSIILAFIMFRFIEQPFRKPKTVGSSPNRKFLMTSAIAVFSVLVVNLNAINSQGWLWRYPADMVAQLSYKKGDYTEFFWEKIKYYESGFENNGMPKVLIVGDSMAANLINVLSAVEANTQMDLATILIGENCKTLFGLNDDGYRAIYGGGSATCKAEHSKALANKELIENADTIVLGSYFWDANHIPFVATTAAYLKKITDAKIMVLGLNVQSNDGIRFVSEYAFSPQIHTIRTPPHPNTGVINRRLINQATDYTYFDLLDLFCSDSGCQRVTKEGYAIIFDSSHFSENGAKFLAQSAKDTHWYSELKTYKQ